MNFPSALRRDGRHTYLLIISAALALLCAAAIFPAYASAGQKLRNVRVGFFAFDGYHMVDENGVRSGYGYEILQHLAGYTNWKYEYIGYDKGWGEMQNMLERGDIDILTSAQKTPERVKRFDFSSETIGNSAAILTVRAGDVKFLPRDYSAWSGMRVGMTEGNSRNADFREFAAEHGFTFTPVYYKDTTSTVKALRSGGQVDAILSSNLRSINGEWILARFAVSPFYIMVRKGDKELLAEANSALRQLYSDYPGLRTMLMDKYYTPDNGDAIPFTIEERAFIRDMRDVEFTALINPDRAPYSSFKDGAPVGILKDIADEIILRSKLKVRFVETKNRAEYMQAAKNGSCDICFDSWYNYNEAERMGVRLTEPYLNVSVSRIVRRDAGLCTSVALVRGMDLAAKYKDYFAKKYKRHAYYATTGDAVDAVLSGKEDTAYFYSGQAQLAVQQDVMNRLESEVVFGYDNSFSVAVSAAQSHLLFSILNKAVTSINPADIDAIVQKHTTYRERPFSFVGYMYSNPFMMAGAVAAFFIFLGLAVQLFFTLKKRKQERIKLADEERRSALLADALAAAEKAAAAKSQFLSRVSHEMRTPLNAIIGFMTLAKDADAEQAKLYLANSDIAARQLLSVINDVLDMSSIEAGKMTLAHAPFDFRHMIQSITNMYLLQCRQKGLTYETRLLTPIDEWLIGDQLRVSQILMNLLGNAVKFTQTGHVWLSISQQSRQDKKLFVRFEISDTGCGMSREMKERLFRPFEQESSSTAQKYGGTGLGLSIVKNLVNMMEGAIHAESSQNSGTTFTIDLPFARSDSDSEAALTEVGELNVLAVDDDAAERGYISAVLGRMGVRHGCAEDGDSALAELDRASAAGEPYNVCIVDWKMPHMNGIEVTKRIRAKYGKDVIVIVASSYEHYQADESARAAGANVFISKPLFRSSLFNLFMSLTGGRVTKRAEDPASGDFTGKRILLAEDNAMNRMVTVGLVKKYGIECETAENGRIAADKFTASAPGYYDAILMDIQMPVMDGFEATKVIRSSLHADAKVVPIIALTANAFNEDIAKTLSAGMNAHVAKPIELSALLNALKNAFK